MDNPANGNPIRRFPVQAGLTFAWVIGFFSMLVFLLFVGISSNVQWTDFPEWVQNLIVAGVTILFAEARASTGLWMDRMSQYPIPDPNRDEAA